MPSSPHWRTGASGAVFRTVLFVVLVSLLATRIGSSACGRQDVRPASHKYSSRTHHVPVKPLLDEAEFHLNSPEPTAELAPPSAGAAVAAEYGHVAWAFDGRNLHYDRPPPLS